MSKEYKDTLLCKAMLWESWYNRQCSRKAVKDGYCKQHHPDAVAKRSEDSERRYKEKVHNRPIAKLQRECNSLREEKQKLVEALEYFLDDSPLDFLSDNYDRDRWCCEYCGKIHYESKSFRPQEDFKHHGDCPYKRFESTLADVKGAE